MNIEVHIKNKVSRAYVQALANFYATRLNLDRSKFTLRIYSVVGLKKAQCMNGMVASEAPGEITMGLDSKLSKEQLCNTIAHEMVHVKQRAKGQLKIIIKQDKVSYMWMGKLCTKDYYDCPWELEAFSRERVLANEVIRLLKAI